MGTFSIWHWIIVLIIVVLVFGTKKLRNLGNDLGSALKGFREGMKESEADHSAPANQSAIEAAASKEAPVNTFKENKSTTDSTPPQATGINSSIADAESQEKTQTRS